MARRGLPKSRCSECRGVQAGDFTAGVHRYSDPDRCIGEDDCETDRGYYEAEAADGRLFAVNHWPNCDGGEELYDAWHEYFAVMELLVHQVNELISQALGTDHVMFSAAHRRHFSEVRCNRYIAPSEGAAIPGQRWISPHKDFTDFSILAPVPGSPHQHLIVAARDDVLQG